MYEIETDLSRSVKWNAVPPFIIINRGERPLVAWYHRPNSHNH